MKNAKRFVALFLILVSLVVIATGCQNTKAPSMETLEPITPPEQQSAQTPSPESEKLPDGENEISGEEMEVEWIVNDEDEDEPENSEDTNYNEQSFISPYRMDEEIIMDNDECLFAIKSVDTNAKEDLIIHTVSENRTSDKTLAFEILHPRVNGYEFTHSFSMQLNPGESVERDIVFSKEALEEIGLDYADEIVAVLVVYEQDNESEDAYNFAVSFAIYPTRLSYEQIVSPDRKIVEGEQTVVDDDSISIIILGSNSDGNYGFTTNMFFENKTDTIIEMTLNDIRFNENDDKSMFRTEIMPYTKVYSDLIIYSSIMEKYNIDEIKSIRFTYEAHDLANEEYKMVSSGEYTYNP